jgi:hypothetical protein
MVAELGSPNEEHELTLGDFVTGGSLLPAGIFLAVTVANLCMLWDPCRQTLIDKLCSDVVVNEPPQPSTARESGAAPGGPRHLTDQFAGGQP